MECSEEGKKNVDIAMKDHLLNGNTSSVLTEKEKEVVKLSFGLECDRMSPEEICEKLHLTKEGYRMRKNRGCKLILREARKLSPDYDEEKERAKSNMNNMFIEKMSTIGVGNGPFSFKKPEPKSTVEYYEIKNKGD